mmetsp:Transcript_15080/g.38779  ORF Transcript_15080/g.38779 Transcript_15080/m.38779 type:complete len:216 (-) Transcript_15080:360-1007(-)
MDMPLRLHAQPACQHYAICPHQPIHSETLRRRGLGALRGVFQHVLDALIHDARHVGVRAVVLLDRLLQAVQLLQRGGEGGHLAVSAPVEVKVRQNLDAERLGDGLVGVKLHLEQQDVGIVLHQACQPGVQPPACVAPVRIEVNNHQPVAGITHLLQELVHARDVHHVRVHVLLPPLEPLRGLLLRFRLLRSRANRQPVTSCVRTGRRQRSAAKLR